MYANQRYAWRFRYKFCSAFLYILLMEWQAGGFLFSGKNHIVVEERELESVSTNHDHDFVETASLLEQVPLKFAWRFS